LTDAQIYSQALKMEPNISVFSKDYESLKFEHGEQILCTIVHDPTPEDGYYDNDYVTKLANLCEFQPFVFLVNMFSS